MYKSFQSLKGGLFAEKGGLFAENRPPLIFNHTNDKGGLSADT